MHQFSQNEGCPSTLESFKCHFDRAVVMRLKCAPIHPGNESHVPSAVTLRLVSHIAIILTRFMTESHFTDTSNVSLTTTAADHPSAFARAFNSGDPQAVELLYEESSTFVSSPGTPHSGQDRIAANTSFQALGLPLAVQLRHVYETNDIALLNVDWTISGTTPEGELINIRGTATDVARRGDDGFWRYLIDNPFGTAGAHDTHHNHG